MKKTFLLAASFSIFLFAGQKLLHAQGSNYDRAGRWGLGLATTSGASTGPGIRYWFTNRIGADLGASAVYGSNGSSPRQSYTVDGSLVLLLKQKDGLRLEGLLTSGYVRTIDKYSDGSGYNSDATTKESFVGLGVGVEYSFQELPDLAFGAFATGLGAQFGTTDYNSTLNGVPQLTTHSSATRYLSSPIAALTIRYYF